MDGAGGAWEVRPRPRLMRAAWLTYLSLTTPVFAVLYWLTAPHDGWGMVLAVHVGLTLVFVAVAASVLHVRICVDGTTVTRRGVPGRARPVPAAAVAKAVMLDLYQPGALDTHAQLFLLGHDGAVLLRLRGQLWAQSDMEALAAAVGAPVERLPQPLSRAEVKRLDPRLLRWFER
ncbi:hypothetical protein [Cryobacterium tepidiphilum]|uniref:PH domain-containing protein n=1 Tax=Cryobacterium tepidiphilum TaxID=2486026 RepID=A0A3M8LCJ9_9MICO|nr:hypothetical protein [Cryobacterium tepidiphilum]RNE62218.1 hypothetical protein EEJ31_09040 [Cryobacterium tepidiphilum]